MIWAIFFYFSNLYYTGNTEIRNFFIISFVLVIFVIWLRTKNEKRMDTEKDKKIFFIWVIFVLTVIITNLINKENFMNSILLGTIIPYFFIYKTQQYKLINKINILYTQI